MTDRRRRLHYAARRAAWAMLVLLAGGALAVADRLGLFGPKPLEDMDRYHAQSFQVVYVVDGDTLEMDAPDCLKRSARARVRLWGVDTPETVKPDTPPQHFGPEASDFTKAACLAKTVRLELDPARTRDKYERLLAYVYLPDGRMLNRLLVAEGYAYADPRYGHARSREFGSLQRQAMRKRLGLWSTVGPNDLPYYYHDLKLPAPRRQERPNGTDTQPEEAVRPGA